MSAHVSAHVRASAHHVNAHMSDRVSASWLNVTVAAGKMYMFAIMCTGLGCEQESAIEIHQSYVRCSGKFPGAPNIALVDFNSRFLLAPESRAHYCEHVHFSSSYSNIQP